MLQVLQQVQCEWLWMACAASSCIGNLQNAPGDSSISHLSRHQGRSSEHFHSCGTAMPKVTGENKRSDKWLSLIKSKSSQTCPFKPVLLGPKHPAPSFHSHWWTPNLDLFDASWYVAILEGWESLSLWLCAQACHPCSTEVGGGNMSKQCGSRAALGGKECVARVIKKAIDVGRA